MRGLFDKKRVYHFFELTIGQGTRMQLRLLAHGDEKKCGHRAYAKELRKLRLLVYIDFEHVELSVILFCDFVKVGRSGFAGATPRGIEV